MFINKSKPVLINDQYAYPLHKITAIPLFYGKSSKNPYYSPLFDFIVGKALDLRKATSSLCLNPSEIKKTAMNLINAVLISE